MRIGKLSESGKPVVANMLPPYYSKAVFCWLELTMIRRRKNISAKLKVCANENM